MTTPSTPALIGSATVFVVQDLARSLEQYRDVFGFRVGFTYGEPASYAVLERDEVAIHLLAASQTKRLPGQGGIYVFTRDVDAVYSELQSRGARIPQEPKTYPYGMRDFDMTDLDGNHMSFGMESTGAS
jgi:predicted enzyme related to lactoylglutathione lyase